MSQALSDISARVGNVIDFATVVEVDYDLLQMRLNIRGQVSGWRPMPARAGRNFRHWQPVRVGHQFVVACASGRRENAVIIGELWSEDLPPPSQDPNIDLIEFNDGTTLKYDSRTASLEVFCKGDLSIRAQGEMFLRSEGHMWLDAPHIHVFEKDGGAA